MPVGGFKRSLLGLLAASALAGASGCTGVVNGTPDQVSVETEPIGTIMPGVRHWLAWPKAREHCAAQGKSPELQDLRGSVAIYRCVSR